MGNMRVRHHEAAAADRGHGSLMSPAVHRDPFAEPVVVPDFRIGNPALETVILRIGPDGGKRINDIVRPERGVGADMTLGDQPGSLPDLSVMLNHAIGTDLYVIREFCGWIDDRRRMNFSHIK